ncbi:MAG: SPOR domain-containing protein [Hydrogenophaga sp.]|jgi:cell division protein FtsN|uniref:SPOR domain-containing protein n=1 Tax=Hydrogenophaga sp. TaxID=1904254 RepID=UPI002719E5A9|nr:SPOR domain-containing protein [Hydrogenophaga sp.]MDO9481307.1 SPOR domain-containing protein [Hydrogenophaga sp.]MDO9572177.1 SPOR domain-containing protein [Hydrogenophaga sp.]MDP1893161.1 SPOR domain-containing protein [Hydrogenophaga sp.]MDP2219527.1 SPOR domain-containing protein [Hydrogenophaga sp.]MDP3345429.1 SPOR domain-containing protein [Hydrogenophaga sp.]
MKKPSLPARQQRGSTFVGFVVGLLVGLGMALSVAIYVTRVPVPFVDRGVSRKPAQDVEEAERNKGWNPNAALGSKGVPAAPPVPTGLEAGTIVVPPADGQALPAPGVPAAVQAPTRPEPAADPLGDLVRSRLGSATPAPAPAPATADATAADPFTYFVQAGAYRTAEDAEAQRAKLAMLGIDAQITEREQSGRTVFRVRVGPFNQKAMADVTREQLDINGVEAALVRVER